MNIIAEINRYAAETEAMPTGEAKATRKAAVTDARHFARSGQPEKAQRTMARAAADAKRYAPMGLREYLAAAEPLVAEARKTIEKLEQ